MENKKVTVCGIDFEFSVKEIGKTQFPYSNNKMYYPTYDITIKVGDKKIDYKYRGNNLDFNKEDTLLDVLSALVNDSISYLDNDVNSFIDEYGYKDYQQGKKIYELCKKEYEKLITLVETDDAIYFIANEI